MNSIPINMKENIHRYLSTIIVPHVEHNVSTFMNMKELLRTKRRCMAVSYGMVEQYLYNWSNYA